MVLKCEKKNEDGVSPVVGVMLMLVVTIIIAAVVSGFAGGLASGTDTAPQLSMDVTIKNTGYATSSYIMFNVLGVSEPISTKNIKITTVWTKTDGTIGGTTVVASGNSFNTNLSASNSDKWYQSPIGFGEGVTVMDQGRQKTSTKYDFGQYFGNYTLVPGTTMKSSAGYAGPAPSYTGYGYGQATQYEYNYDDGTYFPATNIDGMQAVLGDNWNELRPGDLVTVKILHIPSGKLIFESDVGVEG